jgi:hypothetical protein
VAVAAGAPSGAVLVDAVRVQPRRCCLRSNQDLAASNYGRRGDEAHELIGEK